MSRIRCAVSIDGIISISMVSNDNSLIVIGLGSLYNFANTVINSPYSFGNGIVNTGMSHHITISKIHHDEIILFGLYSPNKLVLHLVCTHFRLEVVGRHLWRGHQYTVFLFERSFTPTIEEESDVCILLGFCSV